MNVLANKTNTMLRFWWVLVLFGLLFIGTGVCMSLHVFVTFYALNTFFMFAMIAIGLVDLFFAWGNKKYIDNWEWYLINGGIDLSIGILLFLMPDMGIALFSFIISFWLIYRGASLFCIVYTTAKKSERDRRWLLGMGAFASLCGLAMIWESAVITLPHDLMEGIAFGTMGLMRITFGFRMRSYSNFYTHLLQKVV